VIDCLVRFICFFACVFVQQYNFTYGVIFELQILRSKPAFLSFFSDSCPLRVFYNVLCTYKEGGMKDWRYVRKALEEAYG